MHFLIIFFFYAANDNQGVVQEDHTHTCTSSSSREERQRLEVVELLQDLTTEGRVTPPPPYSKEAMPGHVSLLRSPSLVKTNDDTTPNIFNNTALNVSCSSQSFVHDTSALQNLADEEDCSRSSYEAPTSQGRSCYGHELSLLFPPRSQCNNNSTPSAHLFPPPPPLRPLTILQPPAPHPNALPPILPSNSQTAQELSHHLKRRRKRRRTRSCPTTPSDHNLQSGT